MVIEAHKKATVELRLHGGKAPAWLVNRMIKLGRAILGLILEEFGYKELLRRISDPLWFQAFSYVLGYDWDSSGVTTVTIGVLKSILTEEHGVLIAGGKGAKAKNTQSEIEVISEKFGFTDKKREELKEISKIVAKVDNSLIQDGYTIYHHSMIVSKDGSWAVIQQGMNIDERLARRYHWYSKEVKSFVIEPHSGIIGEFRHPFVIDVTSRRSLEAQKVSLDLVKEGPNIVKRDLLRLHNILRGYKSLDNFFDIPESQRDSLFRIVSKRQLYLKLLPRKLNWDAVERAYQLDPSNFKDLIMIPGFGPSTVRALVLISELIYNAELSWIDPVRYTFAVGGKDGVPYPVNVKVMEEVSEFLEKLLNEKKLDGKTRKYIVRKLTNVKSIMEKH